MLLPPPLDRTTIVVREVREVRDVREVMVQVLSCIKRLCSRRRGKIVMI